MHRFRPQLVDLRRELLPGQIGRDIAAGIIVGIVALPLAIAFGIASGVTPQQGLVTAIIAGALIAGFGGSRVQIGGPTGAFVVLVAITIERGLGHLMLQDNAQLLTARLFASVVILSAMAIALFGLISLLERRLIRWR